MPDPSLDRVARVASELIDAEGVLVTLLDDRTQIIASASGLRWRHLAGVSGPRDESFCQWVVDHDSPLVIHDAQADPRLMNYPVVVDCGIRSYLGVPLRSADGATRGALCAIGGEPRDWTDSDVRKLLDIAALAMGGAPCVSAPVVEASAAPDAHARAPLEHVRALDDPPAAAVELPTLTSRERQVLMLMSRGLGNRAIAGELSVSVDTIKTHVSNILRKLQAPTRSAALFAAIEIGLMDPGMQRFRLGVGPSAQ